MYPEKTGLLTIPAIAAVCKMQRKRRSQFDVFDRLFDGGLEQKQVFSNALTIKVDELPPYKGKVHGIGTFTKLMAELDHAIAQEGEGIVLRLVLEGDGNLDAVEPIELSLPDGLKYYESKQYVKDVRQTKGVQRKIFEYIVQGIKPGSWVIPEQVFTYFDLGDHSYKQLKSNQLDLTITPLGGAHSITNTQKKVIDSSSKKSAEQNQLAPLQYDGQWHATQERTMSWIMLLFLLLVPVVFLGVWYAKYFMRQYRQKNAPHIYAKKAFSRARNRFKKAQEYHNVSNMYDMFVELIAHRRTIQTTQVSSEYITQLLQESGWSDDVLERWQSFFNELLQGKFGSTAYDIKQTTALFDQAEYWLDELQKIL